MMMRILITRPSPAGAQLVNRLQILGYHAYHTPLLKIIAGNQLSQLPERMAALRPNDLIIALSPNAVQHSAAQLQITASRWPDFVDYFAIGQTTAQLLQQVSARTVIYPQPPEISENLLALAPLQVVNNKQVLILRGNGGRPLIGEQLSQRGAKIQFVECYRRVYLDYPAGAVTTDWQRNGINTIVVTSSEILQHLYQLVPPQQRQWLLNCQLIVVSERIANNASKLGWYKIKIAKSAHNDALIQALA